MKSFMIRGISALVLSVSVVAPAAAWDAQEGTLRRVNSNLGDLKGIMNDFHSSLIQALRLSTGEASAYADKQVEAQKRLMDGAQQNNAMLERQRIRAAAESGMYDADPNACLIVDMFLNRQAGTGSEGAGSVAAGAVMNSITGGSRAVQNGPASAAREVLDNVAPIEVNGLEISDGTVDTRYWVNGSTVPLSDENVNQAYQGALRNLASPLPDRPVTSAEIARDPDAVVRAARLQGVNARRGIAMNSLAMTMNMREERAPSRPFTDMLRQARVTYNRPVPERISELTQIEMSVLAMYGTPNPRSTNPSVVLQEIRRLLELSTRMQYISLELQMRQADVEAVSLLKNLD